RVTNPALPSTSSAMLLLSSAPDLPEDRFSQPPPRAEVAGPGVKNEGARVRPAHDRPCSAPRQAHPRLAARGRRRGGTGAPRAGSPHALRRAGPALPAVRVGPPAGGAGEAGGVPGRRGER